MKKFRVDIFEGKQSKELYFDDEITAIIKAAFYKCENPESKVFLLREVFDNIYDVVTCIEDGDLDG